MKSFLILFLFISEVSFAASQTLIIAGSIDRKDEKEVRFINGIKKAYSVSNSHGDNVMVMATDGEVQGIPRNKIIPAFEKRVLKETLRKMALDLKDGDQFLIFVGDHGGAPTNERDPLTATISLSSKGKDLEITVRELMQMIKETIPEKNPLRLIGSQCYSGSLHSISFVRPNTCSGTSTNYRRTSIADDKIDPYIEGFFHEVKDRKMDVNEDGKPSIFEGHLAGIAIDEKNDGTGELSSEAYLNMILKVSEFSTSYKLPFFYDITVGEREPARVGNCEQLLCAPAEQNFLKLEKEITKIAKWQSPELTPEIKKVYDLAVKRWNQKKEQMRKSWGGYHSRYMALVDEWNSLNYFEKKFKRDEYRAKFYELDIEANNALSPMVATLKTFSYVDKIKRFMKQANPEQKKKLGDLLLCERAGWNVKKVGSNADIKKNR